MFVIGKIASVYLNKKALEKPAAFQVLFGAGGGTRTHTVSRTILSRLRLPFRHTGI